MEKCCRAGQATDGLYRMRIACWIPEATNTRTGCVKPIAFPLQQWLYERSLMLRYTYSTLPVRRWQVRASSYNSNKLTNQMQQFHKFII